MDGKALKQAAHYLEHTLHLLYDGSFPGSSALVLRECQTFVAKMLEDTETALKQMETKDGQDASKVAEGNSAAARKDTATKRKPRKSSKPPAQ
jgi:hypothetical protein